MSSHPSDSVYTSSSDEHIITAGLRISQARRRRRPAFKATSPASTRPGHAHEPGSSSEGEGEEEGEEGEEGEDLGSLIHEMPESSDGYSSPEDDSDDEASASDSPGPRTVFASASSQRRQGTPSHVSGLRGAAASARHGPGAFNVFAPNHAADHDEALRASLSTLLSCAAAARGLAKSPTQSQQMGAQQQQPPAQQGGRVAVEGIRVVRQGDLPSAASGSITGKSRRSSVGSASGSATPASSAPSPSEKQSKRDGKKKTSTSSSPKSRSPRRSRSRVRAENESEQPGVSYMTLAVSAGALVLLSAITFSAGYAMGREVGKSEGGLLESVTGSAAKGKAVVRGLTRGGSAAAAGRGISMGGNFTSVTA